MKHILHELKDKEGTGGLAQEWVNAIGRGGLIKITTEAYQFFYAIDMCIRRHLTINCTVEIDKNFKQKLTDIVLNDVDVSFYWCLAGQIEGDEAANTTLAMIIKMWIIIRGFPFAKNIMEIYKQETKREPNRPNYDFV